MSAKAAVKALEELQEAEKEILELQNEVQEIRKKNRQLADENHRLQNLAGMVKESWLVDGEVIPHPYIEFEVEGVKCKGIPWELNDSKRGKWFVVIAEDEDSLEHLRQLNGIIKDSGIET